jgi:malate dehydrogenase (oxaloacetate-decarboxylating)
MIIPVWHDDQQGTAAVILAGLINSLKIVGKKREQVKLALIGAGAANISVSRILIASGFSPEKMLMVDSQGILHKGREDLNTMGNETKWRMCEISNGERKTGGIAEALQEADACIALAKSGPGVIKPEWVKNMAKDAIVFACGNPVPEIWPWEAAQGGARIVATGRSDFPNQVNNSLGFPGIFRGVLDVAAKSISDEMCIAAAEELARAAQDTGLSEQSILPTMADWQVFPREAAAVGLKAIEQGVAGKKLTREQLMEQATAIIQRARAQTRTLMEHGLIAAAP